MAEPPVASSAISPSDIGRMGPNNRKFEERAPYDIMWTITTLTDRETIHSLYGTCKYTHLVALPLLWRRLTLDSDKSLDVEECLDAILESQKAYYVRSCRIVFKQAWLYPVQRSRILDKRLRALRLMKNLKKLTINAVSPYDSSVSSTLQGLHCAPFRLESLSTNITPDQVLFDFLKFHPSILNLCYSGKRPLSIPETHLPNLTSLQVSPEALIGFNAAQRPITSLHLQGFIIDSMPLRLHHISHSFVISRLNYRIRHLSVAVDTLTELVGSDLVLITWIFADHLRTLQLTVTGVPYGSEGGFWALLSRFSKMVHLTLILVGSQRHDNFNTERVLPHLPCQTSSLTEQDEEPSALQSVVVVSAGSWDEYSRGAMEKWRHTGNGGPSFPPKYKIIR